MLRTEREEEDQHWDASHGLSTGIENERNANLLYRPMPTAAPNLDKISSARSTTTREKQVREE